MTLRRIVVLLTLLVLPASSSLRADETPDPPPDPRPDLGVWKAQLEGLGVLETVLPGVPLAAAPWPSGGLAVLSIEEESEEAGADEPGDADERPRRLYVVRGEASDLEPVARDLPAELETLHSAGGYLWLGGDGKVWRMKPGGEPRLDEPWLEDAELGAMARGDLITDEGLWLPDIGRLHHLDSDGRSLGELPLPTSAERRRRRLVLRSPNVTRLGDGTLIAGPDIADKTRARHLIFDPGGGEPVEAWTRLPRPEDIEQHSYALLDGEPVFLAGTTQAERLGVFEKLELRIFRLKADRTRAGRTTLFRTDSETIHWYRFEPQFIDWNGDGRQDLLLVQPDGMSPGDLVIELFEARAGRFNPKPKRSKLDAESATWHLGEDFDGDGLPELVVGTGSLSIYRGVSHRRRVIDKEPWLRLGRKALRAAKSAVATLEESIETTDDRPSFRGRVRVGDLDGDGRSDIAVVRRFEGRGVVRLVFVRR